MSYQIVLTKIDELKKGEIEKCLAETGTRIAKRPAAHPDILTTSGRTGEGLPELRAAIARLLDERQPG